MPLRCRRGLHLGSKGGRLGQELDATDMSPEVGPEEDDLTVDRGGNWPSSCRPIWT